MNAPRPVGARLSARLETILALLEPCRMLVDVGTDHALLPLRAVQRGIAERAIASDLRRAPLHSARATIRSSSLDQRVMVVREDGLSALARNSVDAVVMAGMSGQLMVSLCSAAPHVLESVSQLVVQPNSDAVLVRRWALENGWHLRDERMQYLGGNYFVTCAFARGLGADPAYQVQHWTDAALCLVGPLLLARKDPTALRFSERQCARLAQFANESVAGPLRELTIWRSALEFMKGPGAA